MTVIHSSERGRADSFMNTVVSVMENFFFLILAYIYKGSCLAVVEISRNRIGGSKLTFGLRSFNLKNKKKILLELE